LVVFTERSDILTRGGKFVVASTGSLGRG
jgi:hypothetical protein